jgi:hypothetical protein
MQIGSVIDPVPATALAANLSPMLRIGPPPLGREIDGASTMKSS